MAPAPVKSLVLLLLLAAGLTARAQDPAELTTVASNNATSPEPAPTVAALSSSTAEPPGNSTEGAGGSEGTAGAGPSTEAAPSPGPSPSPSPSPSSNDTEPVRNGTGRSISFPAEGNNATNVEKGSLQDLSLDDIDMNMFMTTTMEPAANASSEGPESSAAPAASPTPTPTPTPTPPPPDMCADGDARYRPGERFNRSCEETCVCGERGRAACSPRCPAPTFRRGSRTLTDPACFERQTAADPCCAVLVCTGDSEPEPAEECVHNNQTYRRGDSFNEGCESACVCGEAGAVSCKPRCAPAATNMSDRCVALPDPADPCCSVLRCDVTLTDHELPEAGAEAAASPGPALTAAAAINSTAVRLEVSGGPLPDNATVEWSPDGELWRPAARRQGPVLAGLEPGRTYFLRLAGSGPRPAAVQVALPSADAAQPTAAADGCQYKGDNYTVGQEFHDGCKALCQCTEHGVECAELECPTDFGLDLLDPHCLEWELQPPGFVPSPPRCCPDEVRCKNNGSCEFAGEVFANFAQIPARLAGCERRCYCDAGNVTCHAACQPVPAAPPADLACPPHEALLDHVPGDDCCLYWTCPAAPAPPRGHSSPGQTPPQPAPTPHATGQTSPTPDNSSSSDGQTLPGPVVLDRAPPHAPDLTPTPSTPLPGPVRINGSTIADATSTTTTTEPQQPNAKQPPLPGSFHPGKPDPSDVTKKAAAKAQPPAKESSYATYEHQEEEGPYDVQPPFLPARPPPHGSVWGSGAPPAGGSRPGPPRAPAPAPAPAPASGPTTGPQDLDDHLLAQLHQQGIYPEQVHRPPPQPRPDGPLTADELVKLLQRDGLLPPSPPYSRPGPPGARPPTPEHVIVHVQQQPGGRPGQDERDILEQLHRQGLLPPHPQGAAPGRHPDPEREILLHLQQQGLIPPQAQPRPRPPHPDRDLLLHLQHQGLISGPEKPGHSDEGPPGGREGDRPAKQPRPPHPDDSDDVLEHFQQGLLPFQQQTRPGAGAAAGAGRPPPPPPPHHPPLTEEELVYRLQQQGLLPAPPPHPPLLLPPPPPPGPVAAASAPNARNHSHADYGVTSLPAGFPPIPGQPEEVSVQTLEPVDATSVRLVFSVPPVFVGLHGRIELRYTADKSNNDLGQWKLQVLAPPKDLLATPTLEFTLGDLQPDTEYRVKITVLLRDLHNTPSSPVLSVRTLPGASSTLPPVVTVTPDLAALEANTTWVTVAWRRFSEFELQLIDGVQLRYKQPEDKVYSATPLIHRAVTTYTLEGLKPATTYEVRIIFIPFPGQTSELQADSPIEITTAQAQDLYKFEVHVEVHHIKATSVEVNWTGVPYPEDKYVNIYRAIYQSDSGKEDFSTFTVAKRDSVASTLIKDLSPGTRYRLWLEIYLTNGKIKKSNVQDFSTRPGSVSPVGSSQQGKLEGSAAAGPVREAGDYYSPLVAVAILAALAILATLILLLMLMRRRGQTKAAISAGRKSQSAYDNPSYKTCDDQPAANGNGSAKTTSPEPA